MSWRNSSKRYPLLSGHAESICVTIRDRSRAEGDKRTERTSEMLGYWVLFGRRIPR